MPGCYSPALVYIERMLEMDQDKAQEKGQKTGQEKGGEEGQEKKYRIVVINPGSTSTKVGVFVNQKKIFVERLYHDSSEMARFETIQSQLGYRTLLVERTCQQNEVILDKVDAFVGCGGGMLSCKSGVYQINEKLLYDCETAAAGVHHPAMLAAQICRRLVNKYGGRGFTVDPPDTDEFQDLARISGLKGIYRESRVHCLNQKAVAREYCQEKGLDYHDCNLIVVHMGGGISVTAHRKGEMVDSNDVLAGDGPMTPTRAGSIPTTKILKLAFSGNYTYDQLEERLTRKGGLIDQLGTDDAVEIERRITKEDDRYAALIFDAMIYQVAKQIGACAMVLKGKVDAILITGGMSRSDYIVERLKDYAGWLAPVWVKPGEMEMEALAAGAYRALRGEEEILTYTGVPVFKGFHSRRYKI